ncbi:MAG: hypothetical protein HGA75_17135 [Thiobacillus sp.]|nr:hypothetical protein [Thiobacillus sp.]
MTRFLLVLNLVALVAGLAWPYLVNLRTASLQEFNAGKIRVWSQPAAYKPGAKAADSAKPVVTTALCVEVSEMSQARFQEVGGLLKTAGLEGGACSYRFDKELAWWVFWPPEYEAARRDKVMKSIQAAGVKDVMAITQGAMAQAYSLGVFTNETQANQYRDTLRGKGLDKVEYGPRPSMGTGHLGCAADEAGKLAGLKASLPAWAKAVEERMCWPAGR